MRRQHQVRTDAVDGARRGSRRLAAAGACVYASADGPRKHCVGVEVDLDAED